MMKNSHLSKIVLTKFAPQKTTIFFQFSCSFWKAWFCSSLFHWKSDIQMNFFGKRSQILKQTFSYTMRIWNDIFQNVRFLIENLWSRQISKTTFFEWSYFGKNLIFEKSGFEFNFFWKIRFRWKNLIWKKLIWLNLHRRKQQNFSFFLLFFKRHDFEANLFVENKSLKWSFFRKKRISFWSKFFRRKGAFERKFFQHVRFWMETFSFRQTSKTKLLEKSSFGGKLFSKKQGLSSIFLRNQVMMKNSHLSKIVLTKFAPQKTTIFFQFSCSFWKAWFCSSLFHWKSDIQMNFFLEKGVRFWSKLFPTQWEFEMTFFKMSET